MLAKTKKSIINELAYWQKLPVTTQEEILRQGNLDLLYPMTMNSPLPESLQFKLVLYHHGRLQTLLALNPFLSDTIQLLLAKAQDSSVPETLTANQHLSLTTAITLYYQENPVVRSRLEIIHKALYKKIQQAEQRLIHEYNLDFIQLQPSWRESPLKEQIKFLMLQKINPYTSSFVF